MQRTRRQTSLIGHVRAAMSQLDESMMPAAQTMPEDLPRRHGDHEQLVRWESEGGAIRVPTTRLEDAVTMRAQRLPAGTVGPGGSDRVERAAG